MSAAGGGAGAGGDAGDLQALYQQLILDHSRTPHGTGPTGDWPHRSHQVNPTCGDEVTFAVRLDATGSRIEGVRWEGSGCAISQASASLLAGLLEDSDSPADARVLADEFREVLRSRGALALDEERFGDAVALGGVARYIARVKCAMLPWVAMEHALDLAGRDAGVGSGATA